MCHYSDVIMNTTASQIPAWRLFTQPFIHAQIKENSQAPHHWPLCGEFTGDRWIPRTRVSNAENISIRWRHVRSWSFDCPPPFECYTMGPKASLISVLNVANFMGIGWHQQVGIVCVHVVIYLWFYRLIKETFQPCTAPPAYTRVLFSSDVYDREHAEQLTWNRAWSFTHAYWDIFIKINNSSAWRRH